jgi:ABC-type transport system involved in Fe-S cluster assembly fused permease/ATPase subunit
MEFCNTNKPSKLLRYVQKVNVDKILKSILKRQIPFLIGETITGTIMTYYYGFLFAIIVNSAIWYGISYVVNKYYWKSAGLNDQKYLLHYALSKISSRKKEISE